MDEAISGLFNGLYSSVLSQQSCGHYVKGLEEQRTTVCLNGYDELSVILHKISNFTLVSGFLHNVLLLSIAIHPLWIWKSSSQILIPIIKWLLLQKNDLERSSDGGVIAENIDFLSGCPVNNIHYEGLEYFHLRNISLNTCSLGVIRLLVKFKMDGTKEVDLLSLTILLFQFQHIQRCTERLSSGWLY